jgi:2-(1,2-epoxy-1,2-dihydrophenyl)acetyl-CoA isomerase
MDTVIVERANGVVTATLNRPAKRNAANLEMWGQLHSVITEVAHSHDDRVLVLTGAGGAFCSGAYLTDVAGQQGHPLAMMRYLGDIALALHRLPKPTIAKVGGVAAGAGCNLALGCDLIVASSEARFSEIFCLRGLSLDWGGSWLLPRLIGLHRAKELAFFGEIISADEAASIGLVNRVVPAGELDSFVDGWARRLAEGPTLALSMSKALLNESASMTMSEALEREGQAQAVNFASDDTAEAMRAFVEKRAPIFTGR